MLHCPLSFTILILKVGTCGRGLESRENWQQNITG